MIARGTQEHARISIRIFCTPINRAGLFTDVFLFLNSLTKRRSAKSASRNSYPSFHVFMYMELFS